jgi:hypothetical protein
MKAYIHLVEKTLADGHVVSVWDGEEYQVTRCASKDEIIEAIESVEEAMIKIHTTNGDHVGTALIIPFGLEDEETVADYGINEYMETWSDEYDKFMDNT